MELYQQRMLEGWSVGASDNLPEFKSLVSSIILQQQSLLLHLQDQVQQLRQSQQPRQDWQENPLSSYQYPMDKVIQQERDTPEQPQTLSLSLVVSNSHGVAIGLCPQCGASRDFNLPSWVLNPMDAEGTYISLGCSKCGTVVPIRILISYKDTSNTSSMLRESEGQTRGPDVGDMMESHRHHLNNTELEQAYQEGYAVGHNVAIKEVANRILG